MLKLKSVFELYEKNVCEKLNFSKISKNRYFLLDGRTDIIFDFVWDI